MLARQAPDLLDRAFLLEMAQKWFRLAETEREDLLRDLPADIGRELRSQFELPLGLTEQMWALLRRLELGRP